jgi:hypothetical protein
MNVNRKLSKVLNLRHNYLDFHLRSSAVFSVAVYGWRLLYRLYWGVTTPCICIVISGSSIFLYRCIGELQLPVLLHRRFAIPRFDYARGRILSPRSVPMLLVSFMARSHCLTTAYIGVAVSWYGKSILHHFVEFTVFYVLVFFGIPLESRRSDVNLRFRRKLTFSQNFFFVFLSQVCGSSVPVSCDMLWFWCLAFLQSKF